MIFDDRDKSLTTYQYDYGVPVVFKPKTPGDFQIGEILVFVFDTDAIDDKIFEIQKSDFRFELSLSEREANALFEDPVYARSISYSCKRYGVDGEYLETLYNSTLNIKGTVKYGRTDRDSSSDS